MTMPIPMPIILKVVSVMDDASSINNYISLIIQAFIIREVTAVDILDQ
jgi:hypothetical protein